MDLKKISLSLLLVLLTFGSVRAQTPSPGDVIKQIYSNYGLGDNSGLNGVDEQRAAKIFDPALLKLYERAIKSGGMDDDFFVQGQDFSLAKPIDITSVSIDGTSAKVSATLTQNDSNKVKPTLRIDKFLFVLVKTRSGWLLSEAFCHGGSLTDEWRDTIKEARKH